MWPSLRHVVKRCDNGFNGNLLSFDTFAFNCFSNKRNGARSLTTSQTYQPIIPDSERARSVTSFYFQTAIDQAASKVCNISSYIILNFIQANFLILFILYISLIWLFLNGYSNFQLVLETQQLWPWISIRSLPQNLDVTQTHWQQNWIHYSYVI